MKHSKSSDQAAVHRKNLSRVLRHIGRHGPCSRSHIASGTGLNKTSVAGLVAELQRRGLTREAGSEHGGGAGRPGRPFVLDGSRVAALGMAVNVDYIAVFATDLEGRVLLDRRIGFDAIGAGPDRSTGELSRVLEQVVAELERLKVATAGIAVAIPGLVDPVTGTVLAAPNLGWRDVPLAELLLKADVPRGVPITVDNDANLAALAEYASGVVAGTPDLIYLTGEVGVGGGIVAGGSLIRGAGGFAGEVGHISVDPGGELCGCGLRGCWETKVGLAALVRMATPDHAGEASQRLIGDPFERLAEIERRHAGGDPMVDAALGEIATWLGRGAEVLVKLFNPRFIILGGYFARLSQELIPRAEAELRRRGVDGAAEQCVFVPSNFGFGAASRGAAGLVVDRVMSDPASTPHLEALSEQRER